MNAANTGTMVPKKFYENGIPVRSHFVNPEILAGRFPEASKMLVEKRKEKFDSSGIFLDGFGIVNACVFMDFNLHIWDKLVFCAIKLFCGKNHHAGIKISTIRKATNLGAKSVLQAVKNLESNGYLEIKTFHSGGGCRARSEFVCIDNPKGFHGVNTIKGSYRNEYCQLEMRFSQWGRISKAVFCDDGLNKYAKLAYAALCILGEGDMTYNGKNADLSLLIGGFTKERLQHALRHLEQRGYISIYALCRGSAYTINLRPHNIPYPTMFFCNDLSKVTKGKRTVPERFSDISEGIGEQITVSDIVQATIIRQQQRIQEKHQRNISRAGQDYQNLLDSTPSYQQELVREDPRLVLLELNSYYHGNKSSKPAEEPSEEVKALVKQCALYDESHPGEDYGKAFKREYDLQHPKTRFLKQVKECHMASLHDNVSEDEMIIFKIIARRGIPEEFAFEENKHKLLRCLELMMDTIPGIHTRLENECLLRAIKTLRDIAQQNRRYKIKNEWVDVVRMIHSINKLLVADENGVSLAGFLQHVAKFAAENLVSANVQHYKTSIVYMMESLCNYGKPLAPVQEGERDYMKFLYPLPNWHYRKSCWSPQTVAG